MLGKRIQRWTRQLYGIHFDLFSISPMSHGFDIFLLFVGCCEKETKQTARTWFVCCCFFLPRLLPSIPFPLLERHQNAPMAERLRTWCSGCGAAAPWARQRAPRAQSVGSVGRERTGSAAAGVFFIVVSSLRVYLLLHSSLGRCSLCVLCRAASSLCNITSRLD